MNVASMAELEYCKSHFIHILYFIHCLSQFCNWLRVEKVSFYFKFIVQMFIKAGRRAKYELINDSLIHDLIINDFLVCAVSFFFIFSVNRFFFGKANNSKQTNFAVKHFLSFNFCGRHNKFMTIEARKKNN